MKPDKALRQPPADAGPLHRTTTKADLINAVYASSPALSRAQAKDIYEMTIEEISAALVRGEAVKLSGFGLFSVRAKGQRIGRNPRTRVEAPIAARRVLTFKASPMLFALINRFFTAKAHGASD